MSYNENLQEYNLTNLAFKRFSVQDCLDLIGYYKHSIRASSYVDESTPSALWMYCSLQNKVPVYSLSELQKLTELIELSSSGKVDMSQALARRPRTEEELMQGYSAPIIQTSEEESLPATQYCIPQENLASLQAKLEIINSKAAKYGFSPYVLVVGEVELQTHHIDSETFVIPYVNISLTGTEIKLNGYEIVGMADITNEQGNIVNTFGTQSEEITAFLYMCKGHCDHCHIKQRRYTVFALRNERGILSQVGKSCLKLYAGINGNDLAAYAECLKSFNMSDYDELDDMPGRSRTYLSTEEYLSYVHAVIQKYGWISRATSEEKMQESTAITAIVELESKKSNLDVTEDDIKKAKEAIEWIKEQTVSTSNEYMSNLKNLCSAPSFHRKYIGYVASLYAAYNKATEKARQDNVKVISQHIGEVDDKLVGLHVKCLSVSYFEQRYGRVTSTQSVRTAILDNGNIVKWFGGTVNIEKNEETIINGKVKGHDFYNGENQTLLTLVKPHKKN